MAGHHGRMARQTDTWLLVLARDRCEELLASADVGRLGVVSDGRPLVFPVCHVYVDGAVAFPTNTGTKLHAALSWPYVSFEVDGIADDGFTGWSVMVMGHAEEVTDPAAMERFKAARDIPWRTDGRLRWMKVIPDEISGRQIQGERPLPRRMRPS